MVACAHIYILRVQDRRNIMRVDTVDRKCEYSVVLLRHAAAEQMQMGFDEVLELLDHLIQRGTHIDISYFVDEVLEKECQDELFDYFDEVDGDVEKAIEEFDGVYQPEEVRLARYVWKP